VKKQYAPARLVEYDLQKAPPQIKEVAEGLRAEWLGRNGARQPENGFLPKKHHTK
jgi:hypothetical protein